MLPPTSRYASVGTDHAHAPQAEPPSCTWNGGSCPSLSSLTQVGVHTVVPGDRLDLIASTAIGDPSAVLAGRRRQPRHVARAT